MVFTWPVTWKVIRGYIGDCIGIDPHNLITISLGPGRRDEIHTFRLSSSSCDGTGAIIVCFPVQRDTEEALLSNFKINCRGGAARPWQPSFSAANRRARVTA